MKGKVLVAIATLMILAGLVTLCFAENPATRTINATLPQTSDLSVSITKVEGTTSTPNQTAISFGSLTYDNTNKIFTAAAYYYVDVGIVSNYSSWTIAHERTSIIRTGGTETLDGNVNVTFFRQQTSTTGTQLSKVSYASSAQTFTKSQLPENWLRIYYGIATGSGDATGVTPITSSKIYGTYQGTITLRLTST